VYEYEGVPISQIIVAIEIEIDPCPAWGLALMECSSFAAGFFSTATIR
jgi:hypothetical protein